MASLPTLDHSRPYRPVRGPGHQHERFQSDQRAHGFLARAHHYTFRSESPFLSRPRVERLGPRLGRQADDPPRTAVRLDDQSRRRSGGHAAWLGELSECDALDVSQRAIVVGSARTRIDALDYVYATSVRGSRSRRRDRDHCHVGSVVAQHGVVVVGERVVGGDDAYRIRHRSAELRIRRLRGGDARGVAQPHVCRRSRSHVVAE